MALQKNCCLLCYGEFIGDQPLHVSSNCLPVKALSLEPAGHSFHYAALRLCGFSIESDSETGEKSVSEEKSKAYATVSNSYTTKWKKKSGSQEKVQDYYALLGLGHLRFLATEEQIRKSYHEAALKHHPDKQAALLFAEETEAAKQAKKHEIENHFKSIQEAYEVLSDSGKRRIYDSTDEFDDDIPTDCTPEDFFKVFGPAFMRNARWSVDQPIPSLGDENTSFAEVDRFYNFWYGFKSWREFPHVDELDLEQAETRDQKRWMERQNSKLREKARKQEHARVRALVDNAYKRDPRILQRKEEERAAKQRKKDAKIQAKKLQEEEAAKAAEAEKLKKEEEERIAAESALLLKKQKEKEKKLLRKERTRLRNLCGPIAADHLLNLSDTDVENLCTVLTAEDLRSLCNNMECKAGIERAQLFKDTLSVRKPDVQTTENVATQTELLENGSAARVKFINPVSSYEKKEKQWGREEIELLKKGMQKYPKGTSRRWEVISDYIRTGRSVEEILKAVKTLVQKPDSARAFDSFLEKRKATPSIASPLTTREEVKGISTSIPTHTASVLLDTGKAQPGIDRESVSHTNANVENGISSCSERDIWSPVQEKALIQALKAFPKETSQRWERVAAAVPGKTLNQCKRKFAILKENFRNKKCSD